LVFIENQNVVAFVAECLALHGRQATMKNITHAPVIVIPLIPSKE
jgi:hypothetical protein